MPTTIHLVRHAQGVHNLSAANQQIKDPLLTDLGKTQCAELRARFPFHANLTHLVASPMRRTIYTCLYAFGGDAEKDGKVIALPEIQEVSSLPCDTGSEPDVLAKEFADMLVDLSRLHPGWNDKSRQGPWAPVMDALEERAQKARVFMRDLGRKFEAASDGKEAHIVAVTHGGFLHFLTQDWDGYIPERGTGWENAECRSYQFVDPTAQDPQARLKETSASWRGRRGSVIGMTETEQMELRSVTQSRLQHELDEVDAAKENHQK